MSAEIIQFDPRHNRNGQRGKFPAIVFRPALLPDDLTMDHADTAPCEYVWPEVQAGESGDV